MTVGAESTARTLRLLTFNVWFSDHEMSRRMSAIGDHLTRLRPHIVALQEVTDGNLELLRRHAAWRNYSWTPAPPGGRYYTLIGSQLPILSQQRTPFEATMMDRDLLVCSLDGVGEWPRLHFATSHLESLNSGKIRTVQIQETFKTLQARKPRSAAAVFCGDTNIDEVRSDKPLELPVGWIDPWQFLRPGEDGATFDYQRNPLIAEKDGWAVANQARLRYDRFFVRLDGSGYRLASVDLIDEPVVSDHFGVLLTLAVDETWETGVTDRRTTSGNGACSTM